MSRRALPIAALVAASGFCSLIYQVIWERTLRYNFGGDSISSAIVTGTFLLGLGLGAVLFGRWHRRAFALYAAVEAAIGVYGLASFYVLAPLATLLGGLFPTPVSAAEGLRPIVVVACVLFLLPPCILIGGTGPLMFNCFIRPAAYEASTVGLLYGMNTFGAAMGALAAPFVFLNRVSIPATLAIVGAVNLVLASAIWLYGRRGLPGDSRESAERAPDEGERSLWVPLLALAFLSGFISLSFEVSLVRALFVHNPSSPYNFPAVLIPFLLSIAAGSALFTRFRAYEGQRALRRVGWLFVAAVVAMLGAVIASAGLSLVGYKAVALPPPYRWLVFLVHAAILAVSLPLFLGAALPLLLRLASATGRTLPGRTGSLFLVNSVGAFGGAMLTQFVGFPAVGTRGVLIALFLLGLGAGGWCLWVGAAGTRRLALGLLAGLGIGAFLVPPVVWHVFTSGVAAASADRIEGVTGVAVIDWGPAGGDVLVNGQYMSRLPDHPRHVRLVSFALSLPRRERVLLLGLGGGGMVRELVDDPGVRRLEVVDWSYELPRLLDRPRARDLLHDALHSPKVTLRRADARVAARLYESGAFDVVIDNLAVAHWVGSTSVKSLPYFREIHRILRPGGVFVYHGNYRGEARMAILAGLTETFGGRVHVYPGGDPVDEVVLGSDQPLDIDPRRVAQVLDGRAALIGIRSADQLLGGLTPVTRDQLGGVRPVRDDLLIFEYDKDPFRALWSLVRPPAR